MTTPMLRSTAMSAPTRRSEQLAGVTGFPVQTFKNWAAGGRGPKIVTVEGRPRHRVADVRAWLAEGA